MLYSPASPCADMDLAEIKDPFPPALAGRYAPVETLSGSSIKPTSGCNGSLYWICEV